jgi:hypothetical protein
MKEAQAQYPEPLYIYHFLKRSSSRACFKQLSTTYPEVVGTYVLGYLDLDALAGRQVFGVHQTYIGSLAEPGNVALDSFLDFLGGAFLFFIVKPT